MSSRWTVSMSSMFSRTSSSIAVGAKIAVRRQAYAARVSDKMTVAW
jgi:hypothetical protein